MLHILSITILPTLLIIAAVSDVKSLRIPNWLTALTAVLFFPMALATGMPLADIGTHILVGLALFFTGFIFFQIGLFGGGDAKLMAAAGLWFGSAQALPFLVMTALAGGVLAIVVAIWSAISITWYIHSDDNPKLGWIARIRALKPNVPYGVAFAVGGLVVFKDSWWMQAII